MSKNLLIGNIVGYLVACMLYGQLLPVLTAPAIIGAFIGGVLGIIGIPMLIGMKGGSSKSASEFQHTEVAPEVANVNTSIDDGDGFVSVQGGRLTSGVGIETMGGAFTCLISAGSPIPCESIQVFSTANDDQEEIAIAVYHGDGDHVRDARLIGRYTILGIPKAKKGIPQVEGKFLITSGGRFEFSARENSNDTVLRISKEP